MARTPIAYAPVSQIKHTLILIECVIILLTNFTIVSGAGVGPLRVHPTNPRYFADGTGRAIYLTGSHTWANLQGFATRPFDFTAYLNFLKSYNHNFIRGWMYWYGTTPLPWRRTGPGTGYDGNPKFDLRQFDQAFFDLLRARCVEARDRGVYISIMLFREHITRRDQDWLSHPFHKENNINGINGDPNGDGEGLEVLQLEIPAITALQKAYVKKVVDTLNDLDNVLFEVGNELPASTQFVYHFANVIKKHEATKPKQHPVGLTAWNIGYPVSRISQWNSWSEMVQSSADWISPGHGAGGDWNNSPPATDGSKVVISDNDHFGPVKPSWVWKSFLRGLQPILMDSYTYGEPDWYTAAEQEAMRRAMGYTLTYATKVNLAAMVPRSDLCSTTFCLINPGSEYLVYLPSDSHWIESTRFLWRFAPLLRPFLRRTATVDLSAASGEILVEWFNPNTGVKTNGGTAIGGGSRSFAAPFAGDAVLYLKRK
jgi:hypothetical protein